MSLSAAEQARLMVVAIGRENQANYNNNYCQPGVMVDADDDAWTQISGYKRSITFYKREHGTWCYYCQFSMTSDTSAYEPTIRTLLDTTVCAHSADAAAAAAVATPTATTAAEYPATMPEGDDTFVQAYLANPNGDLIQTTQRACAWQPSGCMAAPAVPLSTRLTEQAGANARPGPPSE